MEERLNHQALLMGVGGPWTMKESPIPKPGPGQALIKMKAASICNMTDLHTIQGYHPPHDHQFQVMIPHDVRMYLHKKNDPLAHLYPKHSYSDDVNPFPTLMGHEGMGEIVELGPKLNYLLRSEDRGFKIGDRVGIFGLFGGLGEYVIADLDKLIVVPDNVIDEEAGLFEPVSILNAGTRKCVFLSNTVCILGAGALGLLAVQFCKLRGAEKIIVSEPIAWKREVRCDPCDRSEYGECDAGRREDHKRRRHRRGDGVRRLPGDDSVSAVSGQTLGRDHPDRRRRASGAGGLGLHPLQAPARGGPALSDGPRPARPRRDADRDDEDHRHGRAGSAIDDHASLCVQPGKCGKGFC